MHAVVPVIQLNLEITYYVAAKILQGEFYLEKWS